MSYDMRDQGSLLQQTIAVSMAPNNTSLRFFHFFHLCPLFLLLARAKLFSFVKDVRIYFKFFFSVACLASFSNLWLYENNWLTKERERKIVVEMFTLKKTAAFFYKTKRLPDGSSLSAD